MTTTQVIVVAVLALAAALFLLKVAVRRSTEFATPVEPAPLDESRARQSMLDDFAGLSPSQRRLVRQTVRRGRQVSDPALAGAAVSLAHLKVLLQRRYLAKVQWSNIIWLSVVAFLAAARVADDGARPLDVVFLVGFAIMLPLTIWRPRWPLRLAERAERLNRALLPAQQETDSNQGSVGPSGP